MATVRVDGLVFEEAPRDFGCAYVIEPQGLRGWFEGVGYRAEQTDRPGAHGAFDVPTYAGSRVVTLSGSIIADSVERLDHMRARLTGLLSEGTRGRIEVDGAGGTTWADVRLTGQTSVSTETTDLEARFQVQFWAADPRRYGVTRTAGEGSSAVVSHMGNFPAAPVLTVFGNSPGGYTLSGPGGRQFVVTRQLVGFAPHEVDMASGWLSVGGVVQTGAVGRADTWSVPPGQRVSMSVSGGLSLTAKTLDTFV